MEQQFADFVALIMAGALDLVTLAFAQPFAVIATNILKRFLPSAWVGGGTIFFGVNVVVFLGYVIFGKMGGDLSQFETWIVALGRVLEIAGPILLPAIGALFTGQTIYEAAKRRNLKVIGYQRGPAVAPVLDIPKLLNRFRKTNNVEMKG